ncbi:MAG: DUF1186 domain-containing protein [Deltaproteobacteria bacterium]
MNITLVLSELERSRGYFPAEAVLDAMAPSRRAEITPRLLAILDAAVVNARAVADDDARVDHMWAMYLLAYFREPAAYPLVIRFARLPGGLAHDLGGDFVTEDLGRVLASVFDGVLGPIHALIEDPDVDDYVRSAAVRSLLVLVATDRITRDSAIAYFKRLFGGGLERRPSAVWGVLVCAAVDLHPRELLDDIRRAYEDVLIEDGYVYLKDVERDALQDVDHALAALRTAETVIGDPIEELSGRACFQPEPVARKAIVGKVANVGRNDRCPCASGKKYKKCCGK